jgi:hypothetical protein
MTESLTADIFFAVASTALIVFAIGWIIIVLVVVKTIREIRDIVRGTKDAFVALRENLKEQPFVGRLFSEAKKRSPRKKKETKET